VISFIFGYILMCFSSWLSVFLLYHIPLCFFSDQTKLAQIVFGNLYMIFALVFLVGLFFFDRWLSEQILEHLVGVVQK